MTTLRLQLLQDHYLVPQARHIIPQHVKQLGAVRITVYIPSMPLQLLLRLTQPRLAALVGRLSPLQLLLLGLHGRSTCLLEHVGSRGHAVCILAQQQSSALL